MSNTESINLCIKTVRLPDKKNIISMSKME